MDLLKDIAEIMKDDTEHGLEVKVNSSGVVVYLDYDPERISDERCIIPIAYDPIDEITYVHHEELMKIFKPLDHGISYDEIKLIKKIMKYLERHKEEINELCNLYDLSGRNCSWGTSYLS